MVLEGKEVSVVDEIGRRFINVIKALLECIALYWLGRWIIKKFEKFLWIWEKVALWSVPLDVASKHKEIIKTPMELNRTVLVRPMPWLIFFFALIYMRMFRLFLNILAIVTRRPRVTPLMIVLFLSRMRRSLAGIREAGVNKSRTLSVRQQFVELFWGLVSAICVPSHCVNNFSVTSIPQPMVVSGKRKQMTSSESDIDENYKLPPSPNSTDEAIINKVNMYANMSGDDLSENEKTEDQRDEPMDVTSSPEEDRDRYKPSDKRKSKLEKVDESEARAADEEGGDGGKASVKQVKTIEPTQIDDNESDQSNKSGKKTPPPKPPKTKSPTPKLDNESSKTVPATKNDKTQASPIKDDSSERYEELMNSIDDNIVTSTETTSDEYDTPKSSSISPSLLSCSPDNNDSIINQFSNNNINTRNILIDSNQLNDIEIQNGEIN